MIQNSNKLDNYPKMKSSNTLNRTQTPNKADQAYTFQL